MIDVEWLETATSDVSTVERVYVVGSTLGLPRKDLTRYYRGLDSQTQPVESPRFYRRVTTTIESVEEISEAEWQAASPDHKIDPDEPPF